MPTSKIAIINRALVRIGERRITSLSDDVKPAREANAIYDDVRDEALRNYRWNFALKRTSLAAAAEAPAWGFARSFPLPEDCLRVDMINGDYVPLAPLVRTAPDFTYQIEARAILSDDDAPLQIRYLARIEDVTLYDPSFVSYLASALAFELAQALSSSNTTMELLGRAMQEILRAALRSDAIENPPEGIADSTWIATRFAS